MICNYTVICTNRDIDWGLDYLGTLQIRLGLVNPRQHIQQICFASSSIGHTTYKDNFDLFGEEQVWPEQKS